MNAISTCENIPSNQHKIENIALQTQPPAALVYLPHELYSKIFDNTDGCTSTCLGLTCKSHYAIRRKCYPKSSLPRTQPFASAAEGMAWRLLDVERVHKTRDKSLAMGTDSFEPGLRDLEEDEEAFMCRFLT